MQLNTVAVSLGKFMFGIFIWEKCNAKERCGRFSWTKMYKIYGYEQP